ncbi:hypothetical protein [Persicitalea sp.]|uniref:hypothetical protein n=1 Tax=Persicitalea sp. TaxID=3100273 RepID=UPI0035933EF6
METLNKPISGIEFVRHLMHVKEQAQRDAVENYRNDPELRAAYARLSQKNRETRDEPK